ncbi:hypothetical protein RBU61_08315 [Tissierella sp. MB52-C2]|uniref:hypothetical protein n=1 Tax=Tissierella sp. MB52-C2 TaxID=3070999 RepID=UPI00280AE7FA|nr:hypothetical protein [Tissierella sp. MB52-C2]WMM26668.1 hypothetical protein RBU61_08315 [Tissierella sp. MB52-C2]
MVNINMIAFDGAGALNITFASELISEDAGKSVEITTDKTVSVAATGKDVHGKAIKVEKDGAVNVQVKGYVEFYYTGTTAPKAGYSKLVGDGKGGVKVDDTAGREYLVLSVDAASKIVGILL